MGVKPMFKFKKSLTLKYIMKKDDIYYVKSLEEDFSTKTLVGKDKVTYQTIKDIVDRKSVV